MAGKIPVYNIDGNVVDYIEKPIIFYFPIREDLIRRAFIFQFTHRLQPKGRYPLAGRDKSAEYFGTGLGLARVPRIKTEPLRGRAAIVTMARGGRRPHVTTPEKKIYKKLNKKELKLAIASALSATGVRELVSKRGHRIDNVPHIPLIISNEFESLKKTSEVWDALINLGLEDDIMRVKENIKLVGSKAKWRGRRRKVRKGPLIIYGVDDGIVKAARNIIGIDVISAMDVSVIHLAPGGNPGRLTIWTLNALDMISKRFEDLIRRYVEVMT